MNTVIRPAEDRAAIVSFDAAPELVADLTGDVEKLTSAIRSLRAGGGTALYDAIFFACRDKLMQDQPKFKFRRAMVILSDGDDNQSRYTRDQALEMAHKADVVIYSISTNRLGKRDRRRQGAEIFRGADRRRGVFPVQGAGPGAVV